MGNILATITDAKIYQTNGSLAKVISGTDYYAFGAAMPSRSYQDAGYSKYRYGFNNMEKDEETGTHHFKYREDDQDAGRFWSVDPLAAQYPWNSPYAFAENRVIDGIDLEGLEFFKPSFILFDPKVIVQNAKNIMHSAANIWNLSASTASVYSAIPKLASNSLTQSFRQENPLDLNPQMFNAPIITNNGVQSMSSSEYRNSGLLEQNVKGIIKDVYTVGAMIGTSGIGSATNLTTFLISPLNLRQSALSFGIEFSAQYLTTGGNIDKLDFIDLGLKTLRFGQIYDIGLGTALDYKLESRLRTIFDKSGVEISSDLITKFGSTQTGEAINRIVPDILGRYILRTTTSSSFKLLNNVAKDKFKTEDRKKEAKTGTQ